MACGGVHVADGGSDPQRGRVLYRHHPSGVGVEGDDGDPQSLIYQFL